MILFFSGLTALATYFFTKEVWTLGAGLFALLIFQLSITEVSSALDHSNMCSSVRNGRQVDDLIVLQFSLLYHVNFE
jgi:hypothetical protein